MDNLLIVTLELGKAILVPSTTLIAALAFGVLLLWSPLRKVGRWITTITAILLLAIAVLPISNWLAQPLETRFPRLQQLPEGTTGIILLGGSFRQGLSADWNQPQLNNHAGRLTAFVALAREYPDLKLVFSGGSPAFSSQSLTKSDIAREVLASLGLPPDRILFENRSRNTCENAIYTAQLVNPAKQQTWVLVDSAMDMPRAVGTFRKAGFQVVPYPVDYTTGDAPLDFTPTVVRNFDRLDHATHEWFGLMGYRLFSCTELSISRARR